MTGTIKPNHKALAAYYETLRAYGEQRVTHEGALETAFQRLLADTARARGWMLVPKQSMKRGGKTVIPRAPLLPRSWGAREDRSETRNLRSAMKYLLGTPRPPYIRIRFA
jgi:hypothetical protein